MLKSSVHSRLIVQYILIARWRFILFLRSKWTPQMKQLHRGLSQATQQLIHKTTLNRSILGNVYSKVQCITATHLVHTDLHDMTETFWIDFDMPDSPSHMVHAAKTNRSAPVADSPCQTDFVHAQSLIFLCSKYHTSMQYKRIGRNENIYGPIQNFWIIFYLENIEYSP